MLISLDTILDEQATLDQPAIYEIVIDGVGTYIGKSRKPKRRLREYPNNVRKLATGQPYRNLNPNGFRRIHRELFAAAKDSRVISCRIIENCTLETLSAREIFWISQKGTLND